MVKHHEWWYIKHLQRYFNKHYLNYDETVEWYANPEPNKWRFIVHELGLSILLICDKNGKVTEERSEIEERYKHGRQL